MFVIRDSTKDDCRAITKLIKELANFEKMPEGPKINEHILQRDGFGEHPLFRCVVAETDEEKKEIIGYIFFYYTYSTWEGKCMYLEDIYVKPEYRDKGVGTALLKHTAKTGVESGCARLDFVVLDWNRRAVSFYENRGAQNISRSEGWSHFRLGRRQLENLGRSND